MQTKAHIRYKTASGKRVPGATTITGLRAKPFLISWANRLGLEGIDSTKFRDKMADVGTCTHYMVQCDLDGTTPDLDDYSPNQLKLAETAFSKYLDWKVNQDLEVIKLEVPLVSEQYHYGGTLDVYCRLNGVLTLLDLKTSKAIYDDYGFQLAAYKQLLEEHGHQVDDARILRIGRAENEGFEDKPFGRLKLHWEVFKRLLEIYYLEKKLK